MPSDAHRIYLAAVDQWLKDPDAEPRMRTAARRLTGGSHTDHSRRPPRVIDAQSHRFTPVVRHVEMVDLLGLLLDRE